MGNLLSIIMKFCLDRFSEHVVPGKPQPFFQPDPSKIREVPRNSRSIPLTRHSHPPLVFDEPLASQFRDTTKGEKPRTGRAEALR